ncbi:probable nucleolar protein 10 [Cephalotrichum gorgonifer]|uniref:Probable nucleolar protein 10 n=1 Tax=Cephalotrichum gorgonifer TaxID=2041049 RepID=A0AAE8N202_9PEZI|nr:probable nucleolar protein 10 [Cephalotrichum gorgonifer]
MKLSNPDSVSVYTVCGGAGKNLPDWLARRRKRSLKEDEEYQNRVELLQDFHFESASVAIRISDDGNWIMSTGTYKPQMHIHNVRELSLSYARHTTSLNTSFQILSSDYSKSIHLQSDRKVEFHTPMGLHYETRVPRYGRDIIYDRHSTEALIPAVGYDADGHGEVFRMNLEQGRFMRSYQIDIGEAQAGEGLQGGIDAGCVNVAAIAETTHNLLAFGTSIGTVEFWDPRSKARVARLAGQNGQVTALDFSPTGLSIATGSSNGIIQLFDLRRPVPLLTKDQGYGFAVHKLIHMTTASQEKKILSADKKIIKIWDEADGEPWTSAEPEVDINDVAWCKDSGLLLTANEGESQHAFFIPQLGPAPKWCTFLDNIVEELAEEKTPETYENYKFLTLPELKEYSLSHLIGKTQLLRPYMHGYFVASKLYDQARLIANPYVWEEERAKRVKEKIEKERESRIRGKKKVKVNQAVVDKLLKKQENREEVDLKAGLLGEDRFGKLFEDEEFQVDETSFDYRLVNPSAAAATHAVVGSRAPGYYPKDHNPKDEVAPPRFAAKANAKKDEGGDVTMRVSSSQRPGHSTRDSALGSRVRESGKIGKLRPSRGNVVGEQTMSFVPASKKKRDQDHEEERQIPTRTKRTDPRRSASGNAFRRL